jgi:hypothetical protein
MSKMNKETKSAIVIAWVAIMIMAVVFFGLSVMKESSDAGQMHSHDGGEAHSH